MSRRVCGTHNVEGEEDTPDDGGGLHFHIIPHLYSHSSRRRSWSIRTARTESRRWSCLGWFYWCRISTMWREICIWEKTSSFSVVYTHSCRIFRIHRDSLGEDFHDLRVQIRHEHFDGLIGIWRRVEHFVTRNAKIGQHLLHHRTSVQRVEIPAVAIDCAQTVGTTIVEELIEKCDLLFEASMRWDLELWFFVVLTWVEQIFDFRVAGEVEGHAKQRLEALQGRGGAAGLEDPSTLRDEHRAFAVNKKWKFLMKIEFSKSVCDGEWMLGENGVKVSQRTLFRPMR